MYNQVWRRRIMGQALTLRGNKQDKLLFVACNWTERSHIYSTLNTSEQRHKLYKTLIRVWGERLLNRSACNKFIFHMLSVPENCDYKLPKKTLKLQISTLTLTASLIGVSLECNSVVFSSLSYSFMEGLIYPSSQSIKGSNPETASWFDWSGGSLRQNGLDRMEAWGPKSVCRVVVANVRTRGKLVWLVSGCPDDKVGMFPAVRHTPYKFHCRKSTETYSTTEKMNISTVNHN